MLFMKILNNENNRWFIDQIYRFINNQNVSYSKMKRGLSSMLYLGKNNGVLSNQIYNQGPFISCIRNVFEKTLILH